MVAAVDKTVLGFSDFFPIREIEECEGRFSALARKLEKEGCSPGGVSLSLILAASNLAAEQSIGRQYALMGHILDRCAEIRETCNTHEGKATGHG